MTAGSQPHMLERLGIAELAERPYTMISGGERQLVLLARALAQEPQFIVLDEPTANLDFGNQGKVMREIRALAASGLGVLFTTHDPNHALRAADRAYLLRGGERIAEGAVREILTREKLEALYGAPVQTITRCERDGVYSGVTTRISHNTSSRPPSRDPYRIVPSIEVRRLTPSLNREAAAYGSRLALARARLAGTTVRSHFSGRSGCARSRARWSRRDQQGIRACIPARPCRWRRTG